jgi:hypothetical protein
MFYVLLVCLNNGYANKNNILSLEYFIPEIEEEVLVGFEGGNAQNPYVLGTQYNGQDKSGYADGKII